MQCPRCLSYVHDGALFCDQCGATLSPGSRAPLRSGGRRATAVLVLLAVVAVASVAILLVHRSSTTPDSSRARSDVSAGTEESHAPAASPTSGTPVERRAVPHPGEENRSTPSTVVAAGREHRTIVAGTVHLVDKWQGERARVPVVVVSGSWLAIPYSSCLGASVWTFRAAQGEEDEPVVAGVWGPGDPVGLWKLAAGHEHEGPELAAWDADEDLRWLPLTGGEARSLTVAREDTESVGRFLRSFALPSALHAPGVLLQGGSVVGWTFGDRSDRGWLWAGVPGEKLAPEIWIDGFYDSTFAGGREERFLEALHVPSDDPEKALQLFAAGCRLQPRLADDETPGDLRSSSIVPRMVQLANLLLERGSADLPQLLDDQVLLVAHDPTLLHIAIVAVARQIGRTTAIALAERIGPSIVTPGSPEEQQLLGWERRLYADAIREALAAKQIDAAWDLYSRGSARFPDDEVIHLDGVELAILGGDWRGADQLLGERSYTSAQSDRVQVLASKISDLKAREGKIVIQFQPGSHHIPTQALLNGRMAQRFLVDTGASITTIPQSTAQALGIAITNDTPRRHVHTAGGDVIAPLIVVSSIELGGWQVHDLQVLVLDLDGQPGVGLLGLNYLQKFRMDLRSDEGILLLEPR